MAWALLEGGGSSSSSLVAQPNSLGQLASHMAAMGGHADLLQLLVARAAPPYNNGKLLARPDQKGAGRGRAGGRGRGGGLWV